MSLSLWRGFQIPDSGFHRIRNTASLPQEQKSPYNILRKIAYLQFIFPPILSSRS
jgi:hypothetical protein